MSPFGRKFADGDRLKVAGAVVTLKVHSRARRVSLRLDRTRGEGRARWIDGEEGEPARIEAMGDGEGYARAVVLVIKKRALTVLTRRTGVHARRLGVEVPKVTLTDTKSRWGSCRGAVRGKPASIRYSWRLALAPFEVADYVAAHECAHLLELNHGPKFWAHVKSLVGDEERRHREWLRKEGARLHAFGRP